MKWQDGLLAATVVSLWGVNFMLMKVSLAEVSPMVLGMLRFAFLLFPAIFFFKRPTVPWYWLAVYGLTISFGQFGLMFTAIAMGLPTGLGALVVQAQVFVTVLLAAFLWREPIRLNQFYAMLTAALGLVLIGVGQYRGAVSMASLWPALGASVSWALGNIVVKYIGRVNPLSLVVWGNASSLVMFALVSVVLYGMDGVAQQIGQLSWAGFGGVLFLAYCSGLIGYAGWGGLLARYPAGKVTPLALLVPVIALLVARVFLNEMMNVWHWIGIALVMAALLLHMFGGRKRKIQAN